jgi:hypothetical protein
MGDSSPHSHSLSSRISTTSWQLDEDDDFRFPGVVVGALELAVVIVAAAAVSFSCSRASLSRANKAKSIWPQFIA